MHCTPSGRAENATEMEFAVSETELQDVSGDRSKPKETVEKLDTVLSYVLLI